MYGSLRLFGLYATSSTHLISVYVPECMRKTKELLHDECSKMESKRKRLYRSQTKEKTRALGLRKTHSDVQQLTKVRMFYLFYLNM